MHWVIDYMEDDMWSDIEQGGWRIEMHWVIDYMEDDMWSNIEQGGWRMTCGQT
jgi:hypothetical protein